MVSNALLAVCLVAVSGVPVGSRAVEVHSSLLKPFEQAEVPAREAGLLVAIHIQEGAMVETGAVLAQIDDSEPQLAKTKAELEVAAAQFMMDDLHIRSAEKTLGVVQAELSRGLESSKEYSGSVSPAELKRLQMAAEQAALAVEQAKQDRKVAQINHRLKQNALELAVKSIARRQITAPFGGAVAQVHLNRGEWVQEGHKVLRIVRLDKLRAEGFVDIRDLDHVLPKAQVRLAVELPGGRKAETSGSIAFISPEVDPVNNQVRIWATVDNPQLVFRPGMSVSMTIPETVSESAGPLPAR